MSKLSRKKLDEIASKGANELSLILEKNLKERGVVYEKIYDNGSYVYETKPEKRNYMFTVYSGGSKRILCWNVDEGWKLDSHLHPYVDLYNVHKKELISLLKRAFEM